MSLSPRQEGIWEAWEGLLNSEGIRAPNEMGREILGSWSPEGSRDPKIKRRLRMRRVIEDALDGRLSPNASDYGIRESRAFDSVFSSSFGSIIDDSAMIGFVIRSHPNTDEMREQINTFYHRMPDAIKRQLVDLFEAKANEEWEFWEQVRIVSNLRKDTERKLKSRQRYDPLTERGKENKRKSVEEMERDISTMDEKIGEYNGMRILIQDEFFEVFEGLLMHSPDLDGISEMDERLLQNEVISEIVRRRAKPSDDKMEDLAAISRMLRDLTSRAGKDLKGLSARYSDSIERRIELQKMRLD